LQSDIHKALFQRIIKEFLTVTTAAGIELDIERDESMNEAYEDAALRHTYMILDRVAANINSTLSDVLSKRKTENDMLLGTVVKKAKEFNIDVPYIECLYQLIQAKETHYGETLS
jgi:ketopantoate reductase